MKKKFHGVTKSDRKKDVKLLAEIKKCRMAKGDLSDDDFEKNTHKEEINE